ncbi:MAG: hypothetical protein U0270_35555 [Labilithrix sp.]
MKRLDPRTAVLGAILAALVAHVGRFLALPYGEKLSFVPDDAFYYFQLGREHARNGVWSFDGGQTRTSGFHLLHAWFATLLERVGGSDGLRLSLYVVVGAIATAAALVVCDRVASRLFPGGRVAALLFAAAAGGTFILPLQAMEWPLAVLAFALAAYGLATERPALFAGAMLVGPACRSDFVLVAGSLFLAALLRPREIDARLRRRLALGFGGSALGALAVALHTYAISGSFLQTSARTKAFWGTVSGYQPLYGLEPSSYAFGPSLLLTRTFDFGPALLLVPIGGLGLAALWLRRELAAEPPLARLVTRWSGLVIVLLPLAYGRIGTAALCWYSAFFVVPFFVVSAALANALLRRRPSWQTALLVAGVLTAAVNAFDARRPIWPAGTLGDDLRKMAVDPTVTRSASWNAGRIGYLGGQRTINIDGLVNDDVYPYLVADRAHCYLVHERVPLVVDQLLWLDQHPRMLGASNGRLRAAMRRRVIEGTNLEAYDVDLPSLAADPACAEDLRSARARAARPYP